MNFHIQGLDLLRGISAFGIVGCHLSLFPRTTGGDLVISLCDFNVGVFAALAGFLMWGAKGIGWEYATRRIQRLLPTYFAWTAVFIIMTAVFDFVCDGGQLNPRYMTASFWLRVVFVGGSATHLWFIACLFYAQLALFKAFLCYDGKWQGLMWIAAGGFLISGSTLSPEWFARYPLRLVAFLVTGYGIGCSFHAGMFNGFLKRRRLVWGTAIGMLIAHVASRGVVHCFVRDWLAVGAVILAFMGLEIRSNSFQKVVAILGATSMGVYLVHPLVTRGLSVLVTRAFQPPYVAWIVLGEWITAWLISFALAVVLKRMPVAKRFV